MKNLPMVADNIYEIRSVATDGKATKRWINEEYKAQMDEIFIFKVMEDNISRVDTSLVLQDKSA